jgi:hypothetical protein
VERTVTTRQRGQFIRGAAITATLALVDVTEDLSLLVFFATPGGGDDR